MHLYSWQCLLNCWVLGDSSDELLGIPMWGFSSLTSRWGRAGTPRSTAHSRPFKCWVGWTESGGAAGGPQATDLTVLTERGSKAGTQAARRQARAAAGEGGGARTHPALRVLGLCNPEPSSRKTTLVRVIGRGFWKTIWTSQSWPTTAACSNWEKKRPPSEPLAELTGPDAPPERESSFESRPPSPHVSAPERGLSQSQTGNSNPLSSCNHHRIREMRSILFTFRIISL